MQFDRDAALDEAINRGASDLHLKVPSPPKLRVSGELAPLGGFEAGAASIEAFAERKEEALPSA